MPWRNPVLIMFVFLLISFLLFSYCWLYLITYQQISRKGTIECSRIWNLLTYNFFLLFVLFISCILVSSEKEFSLSLESMIVVTSKEALCPKTQHTHRSQEKAQRCFWSYNLGIWLKCRFWYSRFQIKLTFCFPKKLWIWILCSLLTGSGRLGLCWSSVRSSD